MESGRSSVFSKEFPVRPLATLPVLALLTTTALAQSAGSTASIDAQARPADEVLPIRQIVLYRSGVGFFERRGTVEGDATVSLRFNTEDVNDILKSLLIRDMGE